MTPLACLIALRVGGLSCLWLGSWLSVRRIVRWLDEGGHRA